MSQDDNTKLKDKEVNYFLTNYQQSLVEAWQKTHKSRPPLTPGENNSVIWMNRKQRRMQAKFQRKINKDLARTVKPAPGLQVIEDKEQTPVQVKEIKTE